MPCNSVNLVPLSEPKLSSEALDYLVCCVKGNWLSYAGPYVEQFESELALKVGASHAVVVNSGTSALHLSLIMAGIKQEDEVLMPSISFVAPANAIRYCGAWPTFIDIESTSWQWDLNKVESFLKQECEWSHGQLINCNTKRKIAAIMPVHLLGGMCDIERIAEIASNYNLSIIEDAAECLGAKWKNRDIGEAIPKNKNQPDFRLVTTSFNGNKIITTGGGGAIFTEDSSLAKQGKHLSTNAKADSLDYYHDQVGYNYRLTSLGAALGLSQLKLLEAHVEKKRAIRSKYDHAFRMLKKTKLPPTHADCYNTYWMYTILLEHNAKDVIKELNQCKIQSRPLWIPLNQLPHLRHKSYSYHCDYSEIFQRHSLSLPCSVGMSEMQQIHVIDALSEILNKV